MIYHIPVSTDPLQEQSFTLFGMNLRLMLYFNPVSLGWQFDLLNTDAGEFITQMSGLTVNSPLLIGKNIPFVLFLADGSDLGINSISRFEFGRRLKLYAIDKGVWSEAIRTKA